MQPDDAIVSVRQQFCTYKTFIGVFQRPRMKRDAKRLNTDHIPRRNGRVINSTSRSQFVFVMTNVQFFPVNFNKLKSGILPNLDCILNIVCAHKILKIENIDAEPFNTAHILR